MNEHFDSPKSGFVKVDYKCIIKTIKQMQQNREHKHVQSHSLLARMIPISRMKSVSSLNSLCMHETIDMSDDTNSKNEDRSLNEKRDVETVEDFFTKVVEDILSF